MIEGATSIKINPVYYDLLENRDFYLILRGGAGTGKSVFLSQKALMRLSGDQAIRGYGVRKVGKDIENSIYKEFLSRIREWGLEHEWTWNKTKHSFENTRNGSELVTLHMEDETRTKSIVNAEFIWVEEMDQLTVEDWDQLDLRLRGEAIDYKQMMGSCNPTDENSWIRQRFFPGDKEGEPRFTLKIEQEDPLTGQVIVLNGTVLQTTFRDNKFLTPQDRARFEVLKQTNPKKYAIYVLNQWGVAEVGLPWLRNFTREIISTEAQHIPGLPVIVSFDFNLKPMTATFHHCWFDNKGHHWHTFDEIVVHNGSVPDIVNRIKERFTPVQLSMIEITGDETGNKRDPNSIDHITSWKIIQRDLRVSPKRMKVPRSNPSVKSNRELCNVILYGHKDLKINPRCKTLLYEMEYTEADENGDILKKNRANAKQRADCLDTWRYVANTFLGDFISKPQKYGLS